MAANITSFTLSFCYGCRYSQHTCWSFGFWLLGHWLEACLRAYGIWTKLHFPKLHESFLEKRLGKPGCALFTWLERIGSSAYWNAPWSYHQTAKGDMCNSNWWMKSLFLAGSLLVSNTFSPINLTTRQSRVTCARLKQCKSNRWKTFLFLADTITFPQIKTTTTSIVLHLYPLAVGRFPARPVWTIRRPCAEHARCRASSHFGRLTHFNEIAGSARFTFIYPEKTDKYASVQFRRKWTSKKEAPIMRLVRARSI